MNDKILIVIAYDDVNVPAVSTALEGFEYRQLGGNVWAVKTDTLARDFWTRVRSAFRTESVAIFSLDRTALQNAVIPTDLTAFTGVTRAA